VPPFDPSLSGGAKTAPSATGGAAGIADAEFQGIERGRNRSVTFCVARLEHRCENSLDRSTSLGEVFMSQASVGLSVASLLLLGCGAESRVLQAGDSERVGRAASALDSVALIITEVAQSVAYGGSTADKVEVFCTRSSGCAGYKVCDTATAGATCSALLPALGPGQRAVISRGTSITTTDEVWLTDSVGVELTETRVGPFPCANGLSQARPDCSTAPFQACASPHLGTSLGSCGPDTPEPFTYSVKFTTNQHGGAESTCHRPVCQELLSAINQAETSINFALYGIRDQQDIIDALAAAQNRGVAVRGVVDSENSNCTAFGYPDTPLLIAALAPGSVACDTGPGFSYIMHNKFFTFDSQAVWTGSTNVSDTETGGEYNTDVAALLRSRKLAQIYETEFEEMFSGLFHSRKSDNTEHVISGDHFLDGTLAKSYFSPTDQATLNAVLPLIDGATETLDIAMFFFTSQTVADRILAAKARGVAVRMILDGLGAANAYSKHGLLCDAGIPVKRENWGGKSHSKWAVRDAVLPSAAVVFGSMNWTDAGDAHNDENTLYVQNPAFAAEFQAEFNRQWTDLADVAACP
jgi:phosphatidylserine/phosphatidylglycerophosphate/cardiolipin synthase-like enzyme